MNFEMYVCLEYSQKPKKIMDTKIALTGIKLKEGGMKGLEICFFHQEIRDGKNWNIEDWQDRKIPIGEKLDEVIKAFRFYLMDVFGFPMENANLADCKMKEIKFDGDIILDGELRVLNGDRTVKLKTCKLDDTLGYEKMPELRNLIGQLKDEIEVYMAGKSVMSERQLVMAFMKKKGKFDEAEFESMTEDQLKEKYTEFLEKMGSIVIHQSDTGVQNEDEQGKFTGDSVSTDAIGKEEAAATTVVAENTEVVVKEDAKIVKPNFGGPEMEKTEEEKPVENLVSEEEGELSFAITPVAKAN